MHHPTDRIIHTTAFVTPVVEHWSTPWRIYPTMHRTMSERSYHGATSRSPTFLESNFRLYCFILKIHISDMRRLSRVERSRAVGMLQIGAKQAAVARTLNVSQSMIIRLWARHRQTRNVDDRRCWGASTIQQDRVIRTSDLCNRGQSATRIRNQLYTATGVRDQHYTATGVRDQL